MMSQETQLAETNYGWVLVSLGGAVGLIAGTILSYFFQPGLLRAFASLGDYLFEILPQAMTFNTRDGRSFATTALICAGIGMVLGIAAGWGLNHLRRSSSV